MDSENKPPTSDEVAALLEEFEWPWRIERDWGYDILDSKNRRVTSVNSPEMAKIIITLGADYFRKATEMLKQMKHKYLSKELCEVIKTRQTKKNRHDQNETTQS